MSGRKMVYEDAARMAEDFAVFGSGAETFAPLYYFYRKKDPEWNAYVHDDYLETWITFGTVGFVVIPLICLAVWLVLFFGKGIPAPPEFFLLIGVAMVGILAHAKFDLPFQIYSILHYSLPVRVALRGAHYAEMAEGVVGAPVRRAPELTVTRWSSSS